MSRPSPGKWRERKKKLRESHILAWAVEYAQKNLLAVLAASITTFGLIIIQGYYFHIEYTPKYDFRALGSTVISAAFVGLFLTLLLSISLLLPSFYIGFFHPRKDLDQKNFHFQRILLPHLFSAFSFAVWFAYILAASYYKIPTWTIWMVWLSAFALICWKVEFFSPTVNSAGEQPTTNTSRMGSWFQKRRDRMGISVYYAMLMMLQFFPLYYFFSFLGGSSQANSENYTVWDTFFPVFTSLFFLQISSSYIVYSWFQKNIKSNHKLFSIILSLFMPLMISTFSGNPGIIFARTADITKIGNYHVKTAIISGNGCKTLAKHDATLCQFNEKEERYKLCQIHILSDLGKDTFMLIGTNTSKTTTQPRDIVILSSDIISMELDREKKFQNYDAAKRFMSKLHSKCS